MTPFGNKTPVRDDKGEIISLKASEVVRQTVHAFCSYGVDKDRRLVVSLRDGDIIAVRPAKCSRNRELSITAQDLWAYLVRCQANRITLAKARDARERKAIRLAAQRQARAEKRLLKP